MPQCQFCLPKMGVNIVSKPPGDAPPLPTPLERRHYGRLNNVFKTPGDPFPPPSRAIKSNFKNSRWCSHFFRLLSPFCGTSCFYLEFSFVAVVHHDKKKSFVTVVHCYIIISLRCIGSPRQTKFLCHSGSLWHWNFPSSRGFNATKDFSFVALVHCDIWIFLRHSGLLQQRNFLLS